MFTPIGSRCYDFYKAGIIPNPEASQCLQLMASNGSTIECCHNSIIATTDGTVCPEKSLGIEQHCYSLNERDQDPVNETTLKSERHCQETGGNLVQFGSTSEMDLMADMLMSHPKHSFSLVEYPFLTGIFANPHFPFSSTSSGRILTNVRVDPRYMNDTANDFGECTRMDYVPSFEKYLNKSPSEILEIDDLSNKTELWHWIPKQKMISIPLECNKKAFSVCDHKQPLLALVYGISSKELLERNNVLQNAVGFYMHPMNSLSACIAYCVSKNELATIINFGKICICTKGIYHGCRRHVLLLE